MNAMAAPFRLAVIAGEESGDLLGADLVRAIRRKPIGSLELVGVGGEHLAGEGLQSMFDAQIIAIAGITAVLRDLPRLVRLVRRTARQIVEARPHCVVLIDSPAFNLRVARNIRKLDPELPIAQYVCPSVWAWMPGRAAKMKGSVDHVLCLLPFEPQELERLGGPPGTFVGHRLMSHVGLARAREAQRNRGGDDGTSRKLLLLPGSRRSEVESLAPAFARTAEILLERGNEFTVAVPTIARLEGLVRKSFAGLRLPVEITVTEAEKWAAFGQADAALAASGTVLLELALAGVPAISCYRLDPVMKMVQPFIRVWSAALPNLIADRPIVPELFDRNLREEYLARAIETVWSKGAPRLAVLEGYAAVRAALATDLPAGDRSAEIVLALAARKR